MDKKSIEALYDRFESTGVTGPGNPRVKAVVRRLVTDLMLAIEELVHSLGETLFHSSCHSFS